jgi:hypothetical protein
MRKNTLWIALLSVVLLPLVSSGRAHPLSPQVQTEPKPTLKEQVLQIPANSLVEVRLRTKEKFRSNLGDISDEGFVVKVITGDRKVAFDQVKSIKAFKPGEGKEVAKKIGVVYLTAVAVGVVLLIVVLAAV